MTSHGHREWPARVGSPDKEVLRVRGGHIGIMAGSGAERSTWPHIERWLAARSD
jgi:polyhydroxyalkanoate synthase subunit PhaC